MGAQWVYLIAGFLISLISLYLLILIARAVLDWIRALSRGWQPKGVVLVLANTIYLLTDPPLRFLRRLIPPLRIGSISLDMGFLVLFIGLVFAQRLIGFIERILI